MTNKLLSVIIPAHNEADCIKQTIELIVAELKLNNIPYQIVVVNDNSSDDTENIVSELLKTDSSIKLLNNTGKNGFGNAVKFGLNNFDGEYVAIMMADNSDDPKDLVKFYNTALESGCDCVFGTRFGKNSLVVDYPKHKLFFNRLGNLFIQLLFFNKYNDYTNAFKLYKKTTIQGLHPFLSSQFNLTVELPLKSIIRGYSYKVVPNNWYNRTTGISKFKIKELSSQYLFIIFYCLLEKVMKPIL